MKERLNDFLFHKRSFLTVEFCNQVINHLEKGEWEKHKFTNDSNEPDVYCFQEANSSDQIEQGSLLDCRNQIINQLHSVILEYMTDLNFPWFKGWDGYSPLKFIRYSGNQMLVKHWDNITTLFEGDRKGIPILSIIGVLNDNYNGGDLILFDDKKVELKIGDVVIFPSTFLFPHQVTPVISGTRYSYVSWTW